MSSFGCNYQLYSVKGGFCVVRFYNVCYKTIELVSVL